MNFFASSAKLMILNYPGILIFVLVEHPVGFDGGGRGGHFQKRVQTPEAFTGSHKKGRGTVYHQHPDSKGLKVTRQ